METFTRKKPTDEIFNREMNLRHWVYESLRHAVDRVTDATLLEADQEALAAKRKCILLIMKVAWFFTAGFSDERKSMTKVEEELLMIKRNFLRDSGFYEREIYPSVSRQALLIATDGFNSGKLVWSGGSSSIFKGKLRLYETMVAVKVFNQKKKKEGGRGLLLNLKCCPMLAIGMLSKS